MPVLAVATPFNIELEFIVAPFGRRLLAWLIDFSIQVLYWLAFTYAIARGMSGLPDDVVSVIRVLALYLPFALYHFLQEVFGGGQSLGKRALGLRVVSLNGEEPTLSQYAIRMVSRLVDILFFGLPAAISCGVSKYCQRLGDLMAGTVVIEKNAKADLGATIYRPVDRTAYQVRHPEVMRLTDRDLNGIRNLLAAKVTPDTVVYTAQIAARIKQVLHIEDDREPQVFLESLLEDYNALTQ